MAFLLKQNLTTHLREIVRDRNPYLASEGHFYVREYIRTQMQQWGDLEIDEFNSNGRIHQNLILHLPPISAQNSQNLPIILIAAHYDTVPNCPGADDNGTGVAALLELAREFSTNPIQYPIQIVAFDLEEYGLVGSEHYAQRLKQKNQQIRLMFSLEMLGYCTSQPNSQKYPPGLQYFYPNQGNFIALVGNLGIIGDLIHLKRQIRKTQTPCEWLPVPNRGLMVPQTRLSDHSPFWDLGYNAIMVTDTAFLRNPHYHQESDTLETIDFDFLAGVCEGLILGIRSLK